MTDKPPEDPRMKSDKMKKSAFDVFISHASEDKEMARSLWDALSSRGVRCWLDEERLKPGENWEQQLQEAIDGSRLCLLLLSRASVPSKPWVSREWSLIQSSAWERKELDILPLLLDRVEAPTFLRRWQSLRCDRQKPNLEKLVAEITARLATEQPAQEKDPKKDIAATVERFRAILEALEKPESIDDVDKSEVPDE